MHVCEMCLSHVIHYRRALVAVAVVIRVIDKVARSPIRWTTQYCKACSTNLMFCWPCIIVYQYNKINVMHCLFNLLRIKDLYMFRALLAYPQEALHKRHLVYCMCVISVGCIRIKVPYCVRVISVGCTRIAVELQSWCSHAHTINQVSLV
jgi:hypothetical protein